MWALFILILTLTPGKSVPDIGLFDYDKLGHAGVFMIQSYLLTMGLYRRKANELIKFVIIGTSLAITYGFLIEYVQSFIPDRGMEFYDAVANIVGAIFGTGLFYLHNKLLSR